MCRKVISGHGRFNENYLEVIQGTRKKSGTFTLPDGITLTFYAPHGAGLENDVANAIELGRSIQAAAVEMRQNDTAKIIPVPTPYPFVYSAGQPVINYTVGPPDGLTVVGDPLTVGQPKSLFTIVSELKAQGFVDLHYACCTAGYSDSPSFSDLFTHRGYYVRFKQ